MKILLLGSTGRTGGYVLNELLNNNHEVIALVRNPVKLKISNPNLKIIKGDSTSLDDIKKAITDVENIVSTLGHSRKSPPHLFVESIQNVLSNMTDNQKLIALTGFGVPFHKDVKFAISGNLLNMLVRFLPTNVFNDGNDMGKLIYNSGKQFILIRAPRIVKGDKTGKYRVGYFSVKGWDKINTGDIADFIVKNLNKSDWINEAPILAY